MSKFGSRRALWRIALPVFLATACWCVAWAADEVKIEAPPIAPGESVTVINQPSPGTKVTVIKDSDADTRIEHEAIVGMPTEEIRSVVVKTEPPAPKEETVRVEARPSADYVWVPGYWRWDTDRNTYEWVPGAWRHQVPDMAWHAGRWEKSGEGYVWVAGFWGPADAKDADFVVVKEAPPAAKVEVKTESPGPDYAWVPGHWNYEGGQYQWVAGRWERPASQDMVYVPGQWVRRGDGHVYISGHWDYPEENRAYVATRDKDRDTDNDRDIDRDDKTP